jgi:hypothetical protein
MYATHTKKGRAAIQDALDAEQLHCRARLMTLEHIDKAIEAIREFKRSHDVKWNNLDGAEFLVTTHQPAWKHTKGFSAATECRILIREGKFLVYHIKRKDYFADANVRNGFFFNSLSSYARDEIVGGAIRSHSYTTY